MTPHSPSTTTGTDRPLFADVRAELGALGGKLREMAAAHWELARLEIESDLHLLRRLAVAWLAAAVMALAALPLAASALAEALDGRLGVPRIGWLLILAGGLLLLAAILASLAWRRFCRNFVGLTETLEELREDAVWLKEKSDGPKAEPNPPPVRP
jgi:hypothetical protein